MAQSQYPSAQQAVTAFRGAPNANVQVTTDSLGVTPATGISLTLGGAAVTNAILTLDATGRIPTFFSPDPDPGKLFAYVVGTPPQYATELTPYTAPAAASGSGVTIGGIAQVDEGTRTVKTNAGFVAQGQTIKNYVGKVALSASVTTTVTLETVTAGKTYVITDIYLAHDSATVIDTRLQANGVDIFRAPVKGDTAPVQMAGMESQPNASAGQVVTILYPIAAGAPNAFFNVSGFEF